MAEVKTAVLGFKAEDAALNNDSGFRNIIQQLSHPTDGLKSYFMQCSHGEWGLMLHDYSGREGHFKGWKLMPAGPYDYNAILEHAFSVVDPVAYDNVWCICVRRQSDPSHLPGSSRRLVVDGHEVAVAVGPYSDDGPYMLGLGGDVDSSVGTMLHEISHCIWSREQAQQLGLAINDFNITHTGRVVSFDENHVQVPFHLEGDRDSNPGHFIDDYHGQKAGGMVMQPHRGHFDAVQRYLKRWRHDLVYTIDEPTRQTVRLYRRSCDFGLNTLRLKITDDGNALDGGPTYVWFEYVTQHDLDSILFEIPWGIEQAIRKPGLWAYYWDGKMLYGSSGGTHGPRGSYTIDLNCDMSLPQHKRWWDVAMRPDQPVILDGKYKVAIGVEEPDGSSVYVDIDPA